MNPHSFTGPNSRLDLRLNLDDSPKDFSKPINRVDEIAYHHDLDYREAGDELEMKHAADRLMLQHLDSISDPTIRERIERLIVKAALKTKLFLGVGLDPELNRKELTDELHKPHRKTPVFRKVKVEHKDQIWSSDLVIMPAELLGPKGKYKYIVTVIDVYTKYAWAIPIKKKTGHELMDAFEKYLQHQIENL